MDTRHKKTADALLRSILDGETYIVDEFTIYRDNDGIRIHRCSVYFNAPYDVVLNFIIWALDNNKMVKRYNE